MMPRRAGPPPRLEPSPPEALFDPLGVLDELLVDVGLERGASGGAVSLRGSDPIVASRHRLGACVGLPQLAAAVAAVAFHRLRGGPDQDLSVDLRQAIHSINPDAFWRSTINGEPAPHPLVLDNPFTLVPYRARDGRFVMASAVYPHQVVRWCRLLDVPPDPLRVAEAVGTFDAFELEEVASALGLAASVVRTQAEWRAHEQGAVLEAQPVIGLERISEAPASPFDEAVRPFEGIRVLSFTHAVAGPVVGRTLAEHGADVLGATRPNDFEHDFIYEQANVGSKSAYLDLDKPSGRQDVERLLSDAHVVVDNYRKGGLEGRGLDPHGLAERFPGIVYVSLTCYGWRGPWAERRGFDMNGSAVSGLMAREGSAREPRLPPTGLINDYITGYLGAVGASAALIKRATEGGSWHVTVSLAKTAMWCTSLGLVDPALADCDADHCLGEPAAYDAPSPLGDVHMLAPPVRYSHTPPRWPDPILVPRGSSRPAWRR